MYQVKVYSKSDVFKKTISSNDILSDIVFSDQINGGNGRLGLVTNYNLSDTSIIYGDVIKVFQSFDGVGDTRGEADYSWESTEDTRGNFDISLYTGFVVSINRNYTVTDNTTVYNTVGLASMLKQVYFRVGGVLTGTITDTPENIIEDVIDLVNTHHNWFSYTGTLGTYGSSITLDYDNNTCFDILGDIADITGWKRNITAEGQIYFGTSSEFGTHSFTAGKDVEEIVIQEDGFGLYNNILASDNSTVTEGEDTTSKTAYGYREKLVTKGTLGSAGTISDFIDSKLSEDGNPKTKVTITLNSLYTDSLKPGDIAKIQNINYTLNNLVIHSIKYSKHRKQITFSEKENYTKFISNE